MSTILDALKKSEQERKLNNVPTLSDMPPPQEKSSWPYILFGLVLVVLFMAIIWFFVDSKTSEESKENIVITNETVFDNEASDDVDTQVNPESDAVTVNVISYSEDPATRFAIINGKLFRENEFVSAGVKVESIQEGSVNLIERGERVSRKP